MREPQRPRPRREAKPKISVGVAPVQAPRPQVAEDESQDVHPRDRYLTIYGRKPVLEALADARLRVQKIVLAQGSRGEMVEAIERVARARTVEVLWESAAYVNRLSRNAAQDQGVVADVEAPRMASLARWLEEAPRGQRGRLLLLDGVSTPANVGMILRVATAAGLEGVILPRRGSPKVGPLVIKASAGVAFFAPILRAATAQEAAQSLRAAGYDLVALEDRPQASSLYEAQWRAPVCFVLGNESTGLSPQVAAQITRSCRIPMAGGVESLNVATAAAVLAFELARRQQGQL